VVSPVAGVSLGLLYAAGILALAERDARRGRALSASFHGITAMAVALPLVGETATRLGILGSGAAALSLGVAAGSGLAVAVRHRLRALAWASTLGALATALVLARVLGVLPPFVLAVLALAAAVEAIAVVVVPPLGGGLRWPLALVLDGVMAQLGAMAAREGGLPEGFAPISPSVVVALEVALPLIYVASIGAQAIARKRSIGAFEAVQGPLSLLVGLSAAASVLAARGAHPTWLGATAMLLGAGGYAVALLGLAGEGARNFRFHTTVGGVLALAGTAWVLDGHGAALGLALCALSIAALASGAREASGTLTAHGAIVAAIAAWATGALGVALDGIAAGAEGPWRAVTLPALAGAGTALAGYAMIVATRREDGDRSLRSAAPALLGATAALVGLGLLARSLAPVVSSAPGPAADAGFLATLRTFAIAAAAIAAALVGVRSPRTRELRWLVAPLLALGGLKLLVEDLPRGRPASQFLGFALYGVALIVAPRLARRKSSPPQT
jgi:hypothetical protein